MKQKISYYAVITFLFVMLMLQPVVGLFATSAQLDKLSKIKQDGQLVLGVSADYRPYEFHAVVGGQDRIVGVDIALAQAIADELGVKLVIKEMDFSGLLAALQSGTVDVVVSGMQATAERKQSVDFSIPYFTEKNVFVTKKEDVDEYKDKTALANKRIGVQQGTTQQQVAERLKQELPSMAIIPVMNLLDIVQQTKNGTLDGMFIGDYVSEQILKTTPELAVDKDIELAYDAAGSSVAVAKGNPTLVAFIDGVITKLLNEGKIPAFMNEALSYEQSSSATSPFGFLQTYWPLLLRGTLMTIVIALFSVVFGIIGGTLLALLRLSDSKIWQMLAKTYIDFMRGTPMLIQIYIIFYGLPALGLRLPAIVAGVLAMSLNSMAYVAEIIRAGVLSVDKGQFEAATSLGMNRRVLMKEIILPQAFKNILPALGNEFITIVKDSSILSVISVADLMFVANTIRGNTFQAFTPLIVVAIIYFLLTFMLSKGLNILERRLDTDA